ncbi:MAG: hypothetical protein Q8K32_29945 [Archangium sp.]|nr:hypothetical protein [Archangium sp.]
MRRALMGIVSLGLAAFALIGVMHTPAFRALLHRGPSCPVGGDASATSVQREQTRRAALAARRGTAPAPAREAFGFRLGQDNAEQFAAWKQQSQANCRLEKAGLVQECDVASLTRFGSEAAGTVFFRTDEQTRLVAVLVTTRLPDGQAAALSAAWSAQLENTLGKAHVEAGQTTAALLSQQRHEHHFSDLLASVSSTQMGDGVRVNLEVQWL